MDLDPIRQILQVDNGNWNKGIAEAQKMLDQLGMSSVAVDQQFAKMARGATAAGDAVQQLTDAMSGYNRASKSSQSGPFGKADFSQFASAISGRFSGSNRFLAMTNPAAFNTMVGTSALSMFGTTGASPQQVAAIKSLLASAQARSAAVGPTNFFGRMLWGLGGAYNFGHNALFGTPGGFGGVLGGGSLGGALAGGAQALGGGVMSLLRHVGIPLSFGAGLALTSAGIHGLTSAFKSLLSISEDVVSFITRFGMELELTQVRFEVLSGSVEKGQMVFAGLLDMAVKTPLSLQGLSTAAQLMLGMGTAADDVLPGLERLSEIAAGDTDRLTRLARAVEEVMGEGKLTGLRLRQFASLGIGLKDFAETAGVSVSKFTSQMRALGIPANIVTQTINRLTEGTGRFASMNERVLGTVFGQWQRLVNVVEQLAGKLGMEAFKRFDIAGKIGGVTDYIISIFGSEESREGVLQFFDKVRVVAESLFAVFKAGWGIVADFFGMGAEGAGGFTVSMQELRNATYDVAEAIINFGRVSIQILAGLARVMVFAARIPVELFNAGYVGGSAVTDALKEFLYPKAVYGDQGGVGARLADYKQEQFMKNFRNASGDLDTLLGAGAGGVDRMSNQWIGRIQAMRGGGKSGPPELPANMDYFGVDASGKLYKLPQTLLQHQFVDMYNAGQIRAGPLDALERQQKRLLAGFPDRPNISPEAQHAQDQLEKLLEGGITPFDKYNRQQQLLEEALRGPVIGYEGEGLNRQALYGEGMDEGKYRLGLFEAFRTLEQSIKPLSERLPRTAFAMTAEAQDIINRSQVEGRQSAEDRFADVMERAREETEQLRKEFEAFSAWIMAGNLVDGIKDF